MDAMIVFSAENSADMWQTARHVGPLVGTVTSAARVVSASATPQCAATQHTPVWQISLKRREGGCGRPRCPQFQSGRSASSETMQVEKEKVLHFLFDRDKHFDKPLCCGWVGSHNFVLWLEWVAIILFSKCTCNYETCVCD